ncbi:MAG TPA: Nif3-like dinuclear metal center hexameric protein [Bacteroidetes bacterium]|nr:Nif3-like dinuclear metal center hexameric protein [Bacteroidota bacterium]
MTHTEFHNVLKRTFPLESAMSGDNVGLQVRSASETVESVLTCMEITDAVVDEAIRLGIGAIVTFHPLIYSPLLKLDASERVTRLLARCIRADMSVYCVHTAFDAHPRGTNKLLADRLGLTPESTIVPGAATLDGAHGGMGLFTTCDLEFDDLLQRVASVCGAPVRFCPPAHTRVRRVAIVAGSGMSFFDQVVARADVFITADVKYHAFHAAQNVIGLIDPGHFEMEQFVARGIADELERVLDDCTVHCSTVMTSPVGYYTATSTFDNRFVSVL